MNEMVDKLKAMDAAADSGAALGIVHTLLALGDGTGMDTIRDQLVVLAQHASNRDHRHEAFQLLRENVPGGRDALFNPILEMLGEYRFGDVIDTIGKDRPFLDVPNLVFWRALAQCGLGNTDEALADAQRFLAVAPKPGPAHYAFRVAILRRTGDEAQAILETGIAMAKLSEEDKAGFAEQLDLMMAPNNPFFQNM